MGCLMSICCCCCCRCSDHNGHKKRRKQREMDINFKTDNPVFRAKTDDIHGMTLDNKEMEELFAKQRKEFKPGDSSYAMTNKARPKMVNKPRAKEYNALKKLLDRRTKNGLNLYRLENSIGSGRYAEVFKAYGNKERRYVAIKVIDLKKAEENYRQNFLPKEIEILKVCKHPNIIKMYEIQQSDNRIFMFMEFAPYGTIADWLRANGALEENIAHPAFTKILEAVHHMHSRGIAHRDLKLENILLCNNHNPKISDFSYAINVRDLKDGKSVQFCGSLPYFSPEILKRKPHNPLVSDIWSLGVCFYILLNDSLPFLLGDDRVMLAKQLSRNWRFKARIESKLTKEVKSLIGIMLEPDVNQRPTSARLMNDIWMKKVII